MNPLSVVSFECAILTVACPKSTFTLNLGYLLKFKCSSSKYFRYFPSFNANTFTAIKEMVKSLDIFVFKLIKMAKVICVT